jgi:hypothetical protein
VIALVLLTVTKARAILSAHEGFCPSCAERRALDKTLGFEECEA